MARVLTAADPQLQKPVLDVALSERNLLVLISKLYTSNSDRTLLCHDVACDFDHARIRAEYDALHYAYPTREGAPPGRMHPVAEVVRHLVQHTLDRLDLTELEGRR